MSKVDQAPGSVERGFSAGPVQHLEIDRIRGKLNAQIQLAVDGRRLSLLNGNIGASDVAQIMTAGRRVGNHHPQVIGGKLEWDRALIDQRHAVVNFHAAGLKIKDRLSAAPLAFCFALGVG